MFLQNCEKNIPDATHNTVFIGFFSIHFSLIDQMHVFIYEGKGLVIRKASFDPHSISSAYPINI